MPEDNVDVMPLYDRLQMVLLEELGDVLRHDFLKALADDLEVVVIDWMHDTVDELKKEDENA